MVNKNTPQKSSSSAIKDKKKTEVKKDKVVEFILQHHLRILQVAGVVVTIILSYLVLRSSQSAFQNLINAEPEALKTAFFGKIPYIFYCNRGAKDEGIPTVLSELHSVMGSKIGFAVVNCSQVMPSGKNIWNRFKVKKEWRPSVFATAPWATAMQIPPTSLKDLATLKKFVDVALAPRGTEIKSDKELKRFCRDSSGNSNITCLILVKGSRYTKSHSEIEEQLVLSNPLVPIASLDAKKRRLSFEDSLELPADMFAMKLHAIRNNTRYLSMVYPFTWDNVKLFVDNALIALDKEYFIDDEPIRLVRPAVPSFKQRNPPPPPPSSKGGNEEETIPPKDETKDSKTESVKSAAEEAAEEARKLSKEREAREKMEKQHKEYLYEDSSSSSSSDHHSSRDDEQDEDVIEL